ncbi:MAG: DUF2550 domain-containing protein [Actinomycetota bacterium]|nr:DUF2550 domain-containing protein [Actinomycetota bacterium]
MHTVETVVMYAAGVILVFLAAVLARQRYMLRLGGAIPVAIQLRGARWSYGIARIVGSELQWYRASRLGTRPTKVMSRTDLRILTRRAPGPAELSSLPGTAVVVECVDHHGTWVLAFTENAFTGFVSWLEASARKF